jgi:hypothetical protein
MSAIPAVAKALADMDRQECLSYFQVSEYREESIKPVGIHLAGTIFVPAGTLFQSVISFPLNFLPSGKI